MVGPSRRGVALPRGNLPVQVSGFIGRRRELGEARRLLERARLVTVTGPGGVGKSRLALRVASRVHGPPDGVWLVELAALADPELLASAVADVLGVADRTAGSVLSAVVDFLEDKQLLLVLDNCEHLVDGCAGVTAKLLAAAPGVRVLATSREPLRVAGEEVLQLAPLPVPDPLRLPPGDLSEYESVRLLVERARQVQADFAVTPANRAVVARLCQRLDGLPLAVELAAARLRVLTVQQIEARLDQRFRLLTTQARTAPARHRTLRATLDWSHDLCAPVEQTVWARASVFAGFDLTAAEAVCSGDGVRREEVFQAVTGLVDKSVLLREDGTGQSARYGMLETVREYGRDLLVAADQERQVRRRHRTWVADLTRQAEADRVSPREVEWLLRLRTELPNLRLAMASVPGEPDAARAALSIAVAAQDLWVGGGRYREGQRWLIQALSIDEEPSALRAKGLALAGTLTGLLGDIEAAGRMLAEAQTLADRLGDRASRAVVTMHLADVATLGGDLPRALDLVEQALSDARAVGDRRTVSLCHLSAATILGFLGDPRALDHAEQLRRLGERTGAEWTRCWGLLALALVGWQRRDWDRAAGLVRETLPVMRLVHDSFATGGCLEILAWHAAACGRHGYAAWLLGACEGIRRRDGAGLTELGPLVEQHARCAADMRRALGATAYTAAADEGRQSSLEEAIDYALACERPHPAPSRSPASDDSGGLTARQAQIADLVAQGLTNKDIALRLVISRRTAETHIEHILTRLGFTSRAQIARWATERRSTGDTSN